MSEKYKRYQKKHFGGGKCPLCADKDVLQDFKHWKIMKNAFPWDRVIKEHHMVVPKRHATFAMLNDEEKEELGKIKSTYINGLYTIMAEATDQVKSVPGHFHLHLVNWKW